MPCSLLLLLLPPLQDTFVPELEAELAALRTRAEQAEASASQMEETLKVGECEACACSILCIACTVLCSAAIHSHHLQELLWLRMSYKTSTLAHHALSMLLLLMGLVPPLDSRVAKHPKPRPPQATPLQDVKDKYVRLQADFENYRKRNESEKVALRSTVRGDTVAELLPLVRRMWGGVEAPCLATRECSF